MAAIWLVGLLTTGPAAAAVIGQDEESLEEVIVTGSAMGVTAGGAQDRAFLRRLALEDQIPEPGTLTAEGLFSQFDLPVADHTPCSALFCLTAAGMPFETPAAKPGSHLVGLGFATALRDDTWQREAMNVVAVVDKSGSMAGEPLKRIRTALRSLARTLGARDQLSVVLYGRDTHVHLQPTRLTPIGRKQAVAGIDAIESGGSTYMEAGLRLGFELARSSAADFPGRTRVMLFTDEWPNVGDTSAAGFIGMAEAASRQGIGLTTIGVGVHFGSELATRVSNARGGNLFYLDDAKRARELFGAEFDTMATELAYDTLLRLTPEQGWQITGVYGVPDEQLVETAEGIRLPIATLFLSRRGGGVFVTLAPTRRQPAGDRLLSASFEYTPAFSLDGSQTAARQRTEARATRTIDEDNLPTLLLAAALIDEYEAIERLARQYHDDDDPREALATARGLLARLQEAREPRLAGEAELTGQFVRALRGLSAGAGRIEARLLGEWRVDRVRIEGATAKAWNVAAPGDLWSFGADGELVIGAGPGELLRTDYSTRRGRLFLDEPYRTRYEVRGSTLTVQTQYGRDSYEILRLRRVRP
ncbi:MAG: VWA domain-containing protein [Pseudomonadota bacterium]